MRLPVSFYFQHVPRCFQNVSNKTHSDCRINCMVWTFACNGHPHPLRKRPAKPWSTPSAVSGFCRKWLPPPFRASRDILIWYMIYDTVDLKKSCTSWWVVHPIIYRVLYIPGGFPSTVLLVSIIMYVLKNRFGMSIPKQRPNRVWASERT